MSTTYETDMFDPLAMGNWTLKAAASDDSRMRRSSGPIGVTAARGMKTAKTIAPSAMTEMMYQRARGGRSRSKASSVYFLPACAQVGRLARAGANDHAPLSSHGALHQRTHVPPGVGNASSGSGSVAFVSGRPAVASAIMLGRADLPDEGILDLPGCTGPQ
jgi:hypothetical protein